MTVRIDSARGRSTRPLVASVRDLKVYFQTKAGMVHAVDGVSFEIRDGETLGLVGETGCGKSVTARAFNRLVPTPPGVYAGGQVLFWYSTTKDEGGDRIDYLEQPVDLLAITDEEMREIRGDRIAMIFQDPGKALNPALSIRTQIAEVFYQHRSEEILRSLGPGVPRIIRRAARQQATAFERFLLNIPPFRSKAEKLDDKIDELVANALAAADAVASETEKELGVAIADIGAGTIDLAMFNEGSPFHTSVLPVGGNFVTNDVAIGIKTSLPVAEELKIRHGTCDLRGIAEDEEISVSVLGEEAGRNISRLELCQVIEARMRETFELVGAEMRSAGAGMLPAGLILTGGAAQLSGIAELGREVLQMPVRVVAPTGVAGLTDSILTPAYATAIGLLHWGARSLSEGEPARYESAPAFGILGRLRDALRSIFP